MAHHSFDASGSSTVELVSTAVLAIIAIWSCDRCHRAALGVVCQVVALASVLVWRGLIRGAV